MTRRDPKQQPQARPRVWSRPGEIDQAIEKLQRRINELESLNVDEAILSSNAADDVAIRNVRNTTREVFGQDSPEFRENEHLSLWTGPLYVGMSQAEVIAGTKRGRKHVLGILHGLIGRLEEIRSDLDSDTMRSLADYLGYLNLHPRIEDVAGDLLRDGYPWEAVFAASKALVNYVKERSGEHDLDGAGLMRTVFSRNSPLLAFNDLASQTDQDEQEGMMHLFEGAVLGIRNPGGHAFPEGPEQRAIEYLSLLSLLAYRVQEADRRPRST